MKKLARFSIVLLSIMLLFSCLTDPVDVSDKENVNADTEQNVKPDENPDTKPNLPVHDPLLSEILDPCAEFPDWYMGKKMAIITIRENDEVTYPLSEDDPERTMIMNDSVYSMTVPAGTTGHSEYSDDKNTFMLSMTCFDLQNEKEEAQIIIKRTFDDANNPIFTYINITEASGISNKTEVVSKYI